MTQADKRKASRIRSRTEYMRRKRADPAFKEREQKQQRAYKQALEALAKAHPDEFYVLVNEKLFALGLPAKRKRGSIRVADLIGDDTPDAEMQRTCPHNEGLKKTAVGLVCKRCGKRIN